VALHPQYDGHHFCCERNLYFILDGEKRRIVGPFAYARLFTIRLVHMVEISVMDQFDDGGDIDGYIAKRVFDTPIYFIDSIRHQKRLIRTRDAFLGYGFSEDVVELVHYILDAIRTGPEIG
jgi:hypothetical protein